MEKYDYRAAISNDLREYIKSNNWLEEHSDLDLDDMAETLNDEVWVCDDITGNGGMFYDTEEKCEEYICHNLILFFDIAHELDIDFVHETKYFSTNPAQYVDCVIRCYLVYECIWEILYEIKNKDNL